MAQENEDVQQSRAPALVLGAVLLVVIVVGIFLLTNRGDSEIGTGTREEPSPTLTEFGEWVNQEMPEYEEERTTEMAANGFERIGDVLDDLATRETGPVAVEEPAEGASNDTLAGAEDGDGARGAIEGRINTLRSQAGDIGSAGNAAEAARQAALTTTEIVEILQERRYMEAVAEVRQLRAAGENLDTDAPLEEQRDALEAFFQQAHRSLLSLDVPVTPAWVDSPFVNPWPEPTGPDLE